MSKRKKQTQVINSLLLILLILGSSYLASSNFLADNHPLKELYHHLVGDSDSSQRRITSSHPSRPSEALASSVLTNQVKDQLGSSIEWNGAGAFVINQNKTTLNAKVSSLPYAQNETKSYNFV